MGVRIGWSADRSGALSGLGEDTLGTFNVHGRVYRSGSTRAATLLLRGVYREFGGLDPLFVQQLHRQAFRFHGRLTPYGACVGVPASAVIRKHSTACGVSLRSL